MKTKSLISAFLAVALFAACEKKEEPTTNSSTSSSSSGGTSNSNTNTLPADGYGFLSAAKAITTTSVGGIPVSFTTGTAVAGFATTAGGTTYVDAGAITCNSNTLTKQSNNSYVFTPASTSPTGIDFSSGSANWNVAGSSNVTAFSYNNSGGFPATPSITSALTISKASNYTFSVSGVSGADSLLFNVAGNNKSKTKTVVASTTSVTFTSTELNEIGTTSANSAIVQVTAFKINAQTINGKKYYFSNQTTVTKSAQITN